MLRRSFLVATALALAWTCTAQAQDYPAQPIEFIVPWSPGGGSDTLMRIAASGMEKALPVAVPVINMPGASGTRGLKEATTREPDGYTIAQVHDGLLVSHRTGLTEVNWDDFEPVAQITSSPQFLTVRNDAPFTTFEDFVAYASDNPGEIRVGVTLAGVPHLHSAMIEDAAGVSFSYVGYEGTGERIRGLLGGTIDAAIGDVASAGEFVKNGDLRFLAVGSPERNPQFPEVPTFQELGHDLELSVNRGIVVPLGTPEERIAVLAAAAEAAAADPETAERLRNAGAVVQYRDPEGWRAYLEKLDATAQRLVDKLES